MSAQPVVGLADPASGMPSRIEARAKRVREASSRLPPPVASHAAS
jgi:hypothetical protein